MKKILLIALLTSFVFKSYSMEQLKTTAVVVPVVTTVGVLSDIIFERLKMGNSDFLNKEYVIKKALIRSGPFFMLPALIPLTVAMHCGSKPEAFIWDLLKPALYAFGSAIFLGLSTALVCYNLKDAGEGHHRNRMVANNTEGVFNAVLLFAPFFMAYNIYKNR